MKRRGGFTLIEVLVAMTVLGLGFGVLFSLSARSLDGMRRARDTERRFEFARAKLAEIRLVPRIKIGDRASGSLEDGTQWTAEVFPFVQPVKEGPFANPNGIARIHFSMEWQGRNQPLHWEVDTYHSITEVGPQPQASLNESLQAIAAR
jgi:prepilin-type N-terminal cleavage/methylation domain-containing protein